MAFLYSLGVRLYVFGVHVAALFMPKAQKWVAGRRDWRAHYRANFQKKSRVLWVHTASLGEFEQGRPVIEAFRARFPDWQVVLTFFSPSGYEVRRNYPQADFVAYLPADTRRNAADFLDIIQPDAAIFIKYEFWFHYLAALRQRSTPTLLVSALFRPEQPFFQPWGYFWRRGLKTFTHFFVQNDESAQLLQRVGLQNVTVAGDTRIDRVVASTASPVMGKSGIEVGEVMRLFLSEAPPSLTLKGGAFIIGSSWEADEAVLKPFLMNELQSGHIRKVIIAPHEPSEKNVQRLMHYPNAVRYSQATPETLRAARLLIIDNVGMLNTLYSYGHVAYIGGGFGSGLHNTLEPAAFGLPIIFGPKYTKFAEARAFVERGAAFPIHHSAELLAALQRLADPVFYQNASQAARGFLEENRGATAKVLSFLEQIIGK